MTDSWPVHYLRLLIERAERDPAYMANALASFADAEGRPLEAVVSWLGVPETDFGKLLLCLRPSGERFADMLRTVSDRFSINESALVTVLRQVEVLEALRNRGTSIRDAGLLLAARSRNEEEARGRLSKRTKRAKSVSQRKRKSRGKRGSSDSDAR